MSTISSENNSLRRVRTIADYQFGAGAGEALFPEEVNFTLSKTKRVRYITLNRDRLATVRAHDGRLTLSRLGAERLGAALPAPAYRVTIIAEVAEYILKGKNAMAKHVIAADVGIRAGDEVLVCDPEGNLLGNGNAVLSGEEMPAFDYGVAVEIRRGRK